MGDELFDDVNRQDAADDVLDGEVRLETANRTQVELTPTDLEGLLPPGHAARLVWRFVEGLDLSAFTAPIRSRGGAPGARRSTRRSWWRCGSTPRLTGSGAPAKWIACAMRMMRIGGCAGACR